LGWWWWKLIQLLPMHSFLPIWKFHKINDPARNCRHIPPNFLWSPANKKKNLLPYRIRHLLYLFMHPQIMQDKPGNCPICGMKLIRLKKERNRCRCNHAHDQQIQLGNIQWILFGKGNIGDETILTATPYWWNKNQHRSVQGSAPLINFI